MARTVYFVGAGAIAHSHADALEHFPGKRPEVAAADPSSNARTAFEKNVPDARLFEDSESMLAEPTNPEDIVVVSAPPFVHHDETVAALESGRHVLCEKPLAMNQEEAMEMLAAAKANDRVLGAATCRHYGTPGSRKVAELIREGAIGEPYHVTWTCRAQRGRPGIEYQPESKWFLDRSKSGGGIVMDWGPYEFATLDDLLEPDMVDVRHAWTARPQTDVDPEDLTFDVETHGGATLVYRNDRWEVSVTYERASGTHGEARSVTEIEGTAGSLRWTWTDVDDTTVTLAQDEAGEVVEETITTSAAEEFGPHQRPLVFFDRHVRSLDSNAPIRTNEDAVASFSTIRAIYESEKAGEPQQVCWTQIK